MKTVEGKKFNLEDVFLYEQEALRWLYRAYSNGDEMARKIIQKLNRDYDPEVEENSTVRGY